MGRRVTVKQQASGGGGGGSHIDPYSQPCFSCYNGDYNHTTGFITWDHNLNNHQMRQGDNNGYAEYRSHPSGQTTEFINDQGSNNWFNTWSNSDSSNDRPCLTSYNGYLGHEMYLNSGANGGSTPWFTQTNGSEYRSYGFRAVGTLPGETHQDYAIFCEWGGRFMTCNRSASEYWMGYNYNKLPYFTIPGQYSNPMYSSVSYNRKKNWLALMECNDGYNYYPVLWENVPNLRSIANDSGNFHYDNTESYSAIGMGSSTLQQYFSNNQPGYTTYAQPSGKPTNQAGEDNRRAHTVICDNKRLVMFQMIPGYGAWVTRWNSPTVDGNGNSQGSVYTFNGTTSYGHEQGTRYGARFTQTSDGRYIAMYCPYYYYGSGMQIAVVRVSDGKILTTNYTDSSSGYCPVPFGKSNFLMVSSRNTDGGQGVRFTQFNCDYQFMTQNDGSDVSMLGGIDASSYQFDAMAYSTSYPACIPAIYNTSLFSKDQGSGAGMGTGYKTPEEFEFTPTSE